MRNIVEIGYENLVLYARISHSTSIQGLHNRRNHIYSVENRPTKRYTMRGEGRSTCNVMYIFFQENTFQPKRTNFIPTQIQVNTLIKSPFLCPLLH